MLTCFSSYGGSWTMIQIQYRSMMQVYLSYVLRILATVWNEYLMWTENFPAYQQQLNIMAMVLKTYSTYTSKISHISIFTMLTKIKVNIAKQACDAVSHTDLLSFTKIQKLHCLISCLLIFAKMFPMMPLLCLCTLITQHLWKLLMSLQSFDATTLTEKKKNLTENEEAGEHASVCACHHQV